MTKLEEIIHKHLESIVSAEVIEVIGAEISELVLVAVAALYADIAREAMCEGCLLADSTFKVCAGCGVKLHV